MSNEDRRNFRWRWNGRLANWDDRAKPTRSRPWLLPLLVGIAIATIVVCLVIAVASGIPLW
jgi:hypothetical protein